MDAPLTMREGWRAMRDHNNPLILLAVGLTLLQAIPGLVFARFNLFPLGTSLTGLVLNWVWLMIFLSILTTLYGRYIQGPPLR